MTSVEYQNLGAYLKEKRVAVGLTQLKLANQLKVHVQFVSNWERGLCAPPSHCFQKVLDILRVDRKILVTLMLLDSKKAIEAKIFINKSGKKSA